jgi:monofunctional biosynthetic peptidoglycan transglycosylase
MPRRKTKRSSSRRLFRWLGFAFLAMLMVTWLPVLLLRWLEPPVTAFMLQQRPAGSQHAAYYYQWLDWRDLGASAALAIMAAEDQRFPEHYGFDIAAIQDAVMGQLDGRTLRGASTITQQVAKNLFLWPGRSFFRKAIEAYFAALIEVTWSKQRILEMYLNIAEFGPGIYGIPAASRVFFGKYPAQLTDAESALLAAVLPNPKRLHVDRPSAYVRERQRWIMKQSERLRRRDWLARVSAHN